MSSKEICPVHDETCGRITRLEGKVNWILVIVIITLLISGGKVFVPLMVKAAGM